MLDLRAIEERYRQAEGFDADAAYAAQALLANDVPALIAELKQARVLLETTRAAMAEDGLEIWGDILPGIDTFLRTKETNDA